MFFWKTGLRYHSQITPYLTKDVRAHPSGNQGLARRQGLAGQVSRILRGSEAHKISREQRFG